MASTTFLPLPPSPISNKMHGEIHAERVAAAARRAAIEEARREEASLDAQLAVHKSILQHKSTRLAEVEADTAALLQRADELEEREFAAEEKIVMMKEGIDACDQRLVLTKQLMAESARKLEALRARGQVAEESHREKTIQLGVLGERLLERKQQLQQLTKHCLEQRLRVGLENWRPLQTRAEGLRRWREHAAKNKATAEAAARARDADYYEIADEVAWLREVVRDGEAALSIT